MEGLAGVTAIETNAGAVTVSTVEPLIALDFAWIVELPCVMLVAKPKLFMVATPAAEEFQVTVLERFCILPSVNAPVAVNCCALPSGMEGLVGVTAIETNAGAVTISIIDPLIVPDFAWIVVLPCEELDAKPNPFMLATPGADELQATVLVTF